jgi:branched-chain amino acid aminotransferase
LQVIERAIDRSEVYICEELLMTGTAAQVTAVTHVDHRPIGKGVMGPIGTELRRIFNQVVYGNHPKYMHWVVKV